MRNETFAIRVSRVCHVTAYDYGEAVEDVREAIAKSNGQDKNWEIEDAATPNLDCMDIDDLKKFLTTVSIPYLLGTYAEHKIIAMGMRNRGQIADALQHETICDRAYQQLPPEAKW